MSDEQQLQKKTARKSVDNRLATIEGHIKAIRKMLAEDKDCMDIITQLIAVERSVRSASVMILNAHLDVCVKGAIQNGDAKEVEEMHMLMEMFL